MQPVVSSTVQGLCDLVHSVQHDAIGWHSSGQAGSEASVEAAGTAFCHQFLQVMMTEHVCQRQHELDSKCTGR